jgi:polysaccharide export outer membrane protein
MIRQFIILASFVAIAVFGASIAPVTAVAADDYVLGPGDVVKITVYGTDDLATEAEISQNGNIMFPLLGEVKLGGLTKADAVRAIADRLVAGKYVPNPYVNLLVTQYQARQVSVMGEVNKPGKYPVARPSSVTDLLAVAGGITAKGAGKITVIKHTADGQTTRREIDVEKLLASADMSKNFMVDSGDIIFVPVAPVFYIYGEVRQPGAYPLATDMVVQQALSVGGGLTLRGTERGIKVERKGPDGKSESLRVQLSDKLQANDVLRVPESWF